MTAMPVPRVIPALVERVKVVPRQIVTTAMSVLMTAAILHQAVLTLITPFPVMTVMPVPREIPALVERVKVVPRQIVTTAMPVPMTAAILHQAVLTLITQHPVTTAMSVPMTAAILHQAVLTLITPHPVMTVMPALRVMSALLESVWGQE